MRVERYINIGNLIFLVYLSKKRKPTFLTKRNEKGEINNNLLYWIGESREYLHAFGGSCCKKDENVKGVNEN